MAERVSLRRVRVATGETIANVKVQAKAIEHLAADMGTLAGLVGQISAYLETLPKPDAGFWGRLRWLVRGHG